MRRFLLSLLFIALMSGSAFADRLYLSPNAVGDNFGYSTYIGGRLVGWSGGTEPYFFHIYGHAPGSEISSGTLYLYDFPPGSILIYPAITLPIEGRDFRAFVSVGFDATRTD